MNWLLLLCGVILFGCAYYFLFARDKAWEQHVKSKKSQGIKEEMLDRTVEWENRMRQTGVMFLIFGFIGLVGFIFVRTA
jgi:hypothetical protein